MADDWTWDISYPSHIPRNSTFAGPGTPMGPPKIKITGTNLAVVCVEGRIQLRRFPTGILLRSTACLFRKHEGRCSMACTLNEHRSVSMGARVRPDRCSICHRYTPCKHTEVRNAK